MARNDDDDDNDTAPRLNLSDKVLDEFHDTVQHLWTTTTNGVDVLEYPPSPLVFCRDYVSKSRPCLIRNAIFNKNAGKQPTIVTLDDLCSLVHSVNDNNPDEVSTETNSNHETDASPLLVTVDVTPDGYGDCVRTVMRRRSVMQEHDNKGEEIFVQPQEVTMTLEEFRDRLRQQEGQFNRRNRPTTAADDDDNTPGTRTDMYGRPILYESSSSYYVAPLKTTSVLPSDDSNQGIVYYSRQNDCLRNELPISIQQLFPSTFDWAEEVFQTPLEAVNLWMGNEASVSSMHKDHYENLFYVASGEKILWVCPPCDVPFLYEQRSYPSGVFETVTTKDDADVDKEKATNRRWQVRRRQEKEHEDGDDDHTTTTSRVHWIAPDVSQQPLSPQLLERYPLLSRTHPMEIRVQQGELLYLPALWYHRVTQSCETIAVNYWYDMQFESPHWCYFSLLQQLQEAAPPQQQDHGWN